MSECFNCGKEVEGEGLQVVPGKVLGAVKILDEEDNYTGRWEAKGEYPIPVMHETCPE